MGFWESLGEFLVGSGPGELKVPQMNMTNYITGQYAPDYSQYEGYNKLFKEQVLSLLNEQYQQTIRQLNENLLQRGLSYSGLSAQQQAILQNQLQREYAKQFSNLLMKQFETEQGRMDQYNLLRAQQMYNWGLAQFQAQFEANKFNAQAQQSTGILPYLFQAAGQAAGTYFGLKALK